MTLISRIQNTRLSLAPVVLITLGLLISLAVGVTSAIIPEKTSFLWLSVALILFVLASNKLYDFLLYACPLIFLFAQFQMAAFDLTRWFILLLLGLLSAYLIQKRQRARNQVALGLSLVAFYSMITSFMSYYPAVSLLKSISLLSLAGFLFFVPPAVQRLYPHLGAKEYMLRMYLYFAIMIVISNAIFYLIMPSSSFLGGRFRGWFMNPNGIGAVYGIFFLPILGFEVGKHKMGFAKLGLLLIFLFAAVELFASQSRAGISAGVASLFVLTVGQKKWSSRVIITGMLGLIILAIYFDNPADNLVRRFVFRNEITLQGSGRFSVWIETWNRISANPLFGSGLGVSDTGSEMQGLVFNTGGYTIEKGNSLLGALEELGLVGVTGLVATLLVPILKACWKGLNAVNLSKNKSNLVLIAIVVAGLVNAGFEAWLLSVGSFPCFSFWLFASLLLSTK
jgi:O-antigen ligase